MLLESLCCSLPLAKRLKELGVKQDSIAYWIDYQDDRKPVLAIGWSGDASTKSWSAFSSGELGILLPVKVASHRYINDIMPDDPIDEWTCLYTPPPTRAQIVKLGDTEADARAKMLIHLKEQGIV